MAILDPSTPGRTVKGLASGIGGAIDWVGNRLTPGSQGYSSIPGVGNIDISKSLQNFSIVKPAYASSGALPSNVNQQPTQVNLNYPRTDVNKTGGSGGFGDILSQNPQGSQSQGPQVPDLNINSPDDPFAGGQSVTGAIDEQYNNYMNSLNQQEQLANQRYNEAVELYGNQKQTAEQKYATDKTSQTEAIKKNEALNLSRVRQLLGDLQQSNAARTAITGGGSTSDVLAERFGRTAQEKLSNVQEQAAQSLQRVNDFYNNSIQELKNSYDQQLYNAKLTLDDQLNQITGSRNQSAALKQSSTIQAWQDYYDKINQAKINTAAYKQQYDLWKQKEDTAYAEQLKGFQDQNINDYNTGVADSFQIQNGVDVINTPIASVNPLFKTNRYGKSDDEERLNSLYQTQFAA